MKFLALLLLTAFAVASVAAKDLREVRFPFVEQKEMEAFIAQTGAELSSDIEKRAWNNGLLWMREESARKGVSFWQWLRGMHAADMVSLGYITHGKTLADEIEALSKQARESSGEAAARLKARAAELSKSRDALSDEMTEALRPKPRR